MSPEKARKQEEIIIEQAVKDFVSNPEHQVQVDDKRRRCVDGGYRPGQSEGSMAIAGADLGTSMALLTLENPLTGELFTPQEAFEAVYKYLQDEGWGDYCWHSDTHEGHKGVVVGCGHCNAAILEKSKLYGVNGERVQQLLDVVRKAHQNGQYNMEFIELDREHAERGVLVNTGSLLTVKPWDLDTGEQYFVYDKNLHHDYLEILAEVIGVEYEELQAGIDAQTNATLASLASSQGKPLIEINLDDPDDIKVGIIGYVPTA